MQIPYWIINAHLPLNEGSSRYKNRSGDAFEITPLRSGSDSGRLCPVLLLSEKAAYLGQSVPFIKPFREREL